LPKAVYWFRVLQMAAGVLMAACLFLGGFLLLKEGKSEFAGLAMIFAGVIVFVAPIKFKSEILRDRMTIRIMSELPTWCRAI